MADTLIVKTGSTMPELARARGDYEDWIAEGIGGGARVCDVVAGEALPEPGAVAAAVVTGSSAMVTDRAPWSVRTGTWLAEVARRGRPVLAICYGHQLLADTLGGEVGPNASGREIGQVEVTLTEEGARDALLGGLPRTLAMSSSHRQAVRRLPEGAVLLARGAAEIHQAYRLGERAWAVQFHPEWDHEVMRAYLEARAETLREEGLDPDALLAANTPSDHGARLLARFGELVRG